MTKSFSQRQLDAIADFNWGSAVPPRRSGSKVNKVAKDELVVLDGEVESADSTAADPSKAVEHLGWH